MGDCVGVGVCVGVLLCVDWFRVLVLVVVRCLSSRILFV